MDDVPSKEVAVFSGICSQGVVVLPLNVCSNSEEDFYGIPIPCIDGVVAKLETMKALTTSAARKLEKT